MGEETLSGRMVFIEIIRTTNAGTLYMNREET